MLANPLATPFAASLAASLVGSGVGSINTLAAIGDSNTDCNSGVISGTGAYPRYMAKSWLGFAASRLGHAFLPCPNAYPYLGPSKADLDFGWGGAKVANIRASTVNQISSGANQYPGVTLTPLQAAAATNPRGRMFLIGTNDIPDVEAAVVLTRLDGLLAEAATTGGALFIGELPPRVDSVADPSGTYQTKIVAVNAGLPAIAARYGATVIPWHDALLGGANQANPDLYNDDDAGAGIVRVHPNMAGYAVMGDIFAGVLASRCGAPYPVPVKGSAAWLTSNAYMDAGTTLATGFSATGGATAEIITDADGTVWQQFTLAGAGYVYLRSPDMAEAALTPLATAQTPIRCVCEHHVVSGSCTSLQLFGSVSTAGFAAQLASAGHGTDVNPATEGVITNHRRTYLSVPFTVPGTAAVSTLTMLARFSGAAVFRTRMMGFFRSPF